MKNSNEYDENKTNIIERTVHKLGKHFIQTSVDPRNCKNLLIYEPELPRELIKNEFSSSK